MTNKIRTFIALTIPDLDTAWIAANIRQRKIELLPKLKWVAETNLHLTLKFLGEIEPEQVHFLKEQVPDVISKYQKFDVSIHKIGAFPDLQRPKVIWIGLDAPEALYSIQREIDELCSRIGQTREKRPFSAHITLARAPETITYHDLGRISRWIIENQDLPIRKTLVESVIIYKSELKPEGPIYTPIGISRFE